MIKSILVFLLASHCLTAVSAVNAQQPAKKFKIGWLSAVDGPNAGQETIVRMLGDFVLARADKVIR
jgi:hypothetical protein